MATNYPNSIQTLSGGRGTNTDPLNAPNHVTHHTTEDDTIEALQTKVGVNNSAVETSHDYKLGEVTGSDKAVGKTATQTLTNKTLTSPQVNFGGDATGDIYFRNSGGQFARLPIGSPGNIIQVSATNTPEYVSNPAASDASYSTKGVVQGLTDEATSGLTITSGVISVNSGTTANKIVKLNSSAQLPAVDGSLLTNLASPTTFTNGTTTKNAGDASTTQNIAHGLGKIPKRIKITAIPGANVTAIVSAFTTYNGTTQSSISRHGTTTPIAATTFTLNSEAAAGTNTQTGVITWDFTNIIITWTKTNGPTGIYNLLWEAEG